MHNAATLGVLRLEDVLPWFLALILLAASILLFAKTKRLSAVLQLIGAGLIFLFFALKQLAYYLYSIKKPNLSHSLSGRFDLVPLLGVCLFVVGYVWYALTRGRI
jgi:hypothetical protein